MKHWVQAPLDPHVTPYICEEGTVNSSYSVNLFEVNPEVGRPTVQLLFISRFEGKDLVAVPQTAWNRKVDLRVMPAGALIRPTLLEVAACRHKAMEETVEDAYLRVWVGYLKESYSERVQTHLEEYNVDYVFDPGDQGWLPAAEALVAAAQEHFAFFSAVEGETQDEREEHDAETGGPEEDPDILAFEWNGWRLPWKRCRMG